MSVVDLHPDDLLDGDARGELTASEQERLERHCVICDVCRVERRVRADFQNEEAPVDEDFDVQRLLSEVLAPGAERVAVRGVSRRRRPALRRARPFLLLAAALLVAGASAAAGWTGLRRLVTSTALSMTAPPTDTSNLPAHRSVSPRPLSSAVLAPDVASSVLAPPPVRPMPSASVAAVAVAAAPVEVALALPRRSAGHGPSAEPQATKMPSAIPTVDTARAPIAAIATEPVEDATLLFSRANGARRTGDHDRAADLYRALAAAYPASPEAHESKATLGRMLLEDGDTHAALRSFDDYLRLGGPLEEDVMADRATALAKLGRSIEEAAAWSSLLRSYPSSVHAARAEARLRELGNR